MPDFIRKPLLVVLTVMAVYLIARLALPAAFFDALGFTSLEDAVWSVVAPVLIPLGVYEACVVVSAFLDYREAKLVIVGWRQAWIVAHVTCLIRGWRRAKWIAAGLNLTRKRVVARRAARKATRELDREYVVLDPTAPFDGRIIDADADEDEGAA